MPKGTLRAAMSAAVTAAMSEIGFGAMNNSITKASTAATHPRMKPNLPAAFFRSWISLSLSSLMSRGREIDVALAFTHARQFDAQLRADVDAVESPHQATFNRRSEDADVCALLRLPGHDGLERLAEAIDERGGSESLAHAALDLVRPRFSLRAVLGDFLELGVCVGQCRIGVGCFQQALIDQVGVATIRRGGVDIFRDAEAKVCLVVFGTGSVEHVLAWPKQLDDGQRQVRKTVGIRGSSQREEIGEGASVRLRRQRDAVLFRNSDNAIPASRLPHDATDRRSVAAPENRRGGGVRRDHQLLDEVAGGVALLRHDVDDAVAFDDGLRLDGIDVDRAGELTMAVQA